MESMCFILTAVLVFSFLASTASASDWPMFQRHANRTGYTSDPGVSNVSAAEVKTNPIGVVQSSPAVVGDFVYVGGLDAVVYQLNASNISVIYAYFGTGDMVYSSPAVAGGFVYVGSDDGFLYQLNSSNVSLMHANFSTGVNVRSAPAVSDGFVYLCSSDGMVYQLNASNVSLMHANFSTGATLHASPAVYGGFVYLGDGDGLFYQLNASNVSIQHASFTTPNAIASSPVVAGGFVYFGNEDGTLYRLNASNMSGNYSSITFGLPIESSPAAFGDFVYVGTFNDNLVQMKADDFSSPYAELLLDVGEFISSSPAVTDEFVYVGSSSGVMYQLNVSNVSHVIANYTVLEVIYSSPAVSGESVYFGSDDGNIYSLTNPGQALGPALALTVEYPTEAINVTRYEFFNFTVSAACSYSDCGPVNLTLYYHVSTEVPSDGGTPFYTNVSNPYSCGNIAAAGTCTAVWRINATGPPETYELFAQAFNSTAALTGATDAVKVTILEESSASQVNMELVYPLGDVNVTQNRWFNVTVNVGCVGASCGVVNVSLDPSYSVTLTAGNISEDGEVKFDGESTYTRTTGTVLIKIGYPSDDYNYYRSYIEFNTSSIPDSATITAVVLNISSTQQGALSPTTVYNMSNRPLATGNNPALYSDLGDGAVYASWDAGDICSGSPPETCWHNHTLSPQASTDLQALLSADWFAIGLTGEEILEDEHTDISTVESAGDPQLTVTYTHGKGLINTTEGATPFYTNMSTNPYGTASLDAGDSELLTFWVNATGGTDTAWEFYVYTNQSSNPSIGNETVHWSVTIRSTYSSSSTSSTSSSSSSSSTGSSSSTEPTTNPDPSPRRRTTTSTVQTTSTSQTTLTSLTTSTTVTSTTTSSTTTSTTSVSSTTTTLGGGRHGGYSVSEDVPSIREADVVSTSEFNITLRLRSRNYVHPGEEFTVEAEVQSTRDVNGVNLSFMDSEGMVLSSPAGVTLDLEAGVPESVVWEVSVSEGAGVRHNLSVAAYDSAGSLRSREMSEVTVLEPLRIPLPGGGLDVPDVRVVQDRTFVLANMVFSLIYSNRAAVMVSMLLLTVLGYLYYSMRRRNSMFV